MKAPLRLKMMKSDSYSGVVKRPNTGMRTTKGVKSVHCKKANVSMMFKNVLQNKSNLCNN